MQKLLFPLVAALLLAAVPQKSFSQNPVGEKPAAGTEATAPVVIETSALPKPAADGPVPAVRRKQTGRFYGKVVDEHGKGVGYATVRLFGKKFDPATRTAKDTLLAGQLTLDNGDFSLEGLPVVGDFELAVSFLGYSEKRIPATFGIKPPPTANGGRPTTDGSSGRPTSGGRPSGGFPSQNEGGEGGFSGGPGGGGLFEKDLGNIRLGEESAVLKEVTVTAKTSATGLAIDRKTFQVDKDLSAAGGTAQDALKNVPSLSVDLDGNVSLRNSAPQIFVDGRPTMLTLDQIPASDIESVEVITNPSAKFDAGGGPAGIVNIVLKKEKRLGYNGNVRAGTDSKLGYNLGGDLNARGAKVNLFASGSFNQNRMDGEGETTRHNLFGDPLSDVSQVSKNDQDGRMINGRMGLDYFIDNRNTLTFSGNLMRRAGDPSDRITTETSLLYPTGTVTSSYLRASEVKRRFTNLGGSAQFKHLFPKKGAEWTADLNFNRLWPRGDSDYLTTFDTGAESQERQVSRNRSRQFNGQVDFVNPIGEHGKLEAGIKANMRRNVHNNTSDLFDEEENVWVRVAQPSDRYQYSDDVYAAYLQGSRQVGSWGFQAGLRAESSFFRGELTEADSSFSIEYPIRLFPSLFVSRKLAGGDQVQLALTRRVNRPGFFQTMPFTDFTDSLNLKRGNPQLLPEFTNSVELSYQKIFAKGHNLLASVYYKRSENVITGYQFTEYNAQLGREVVVTGYQNGDWASAAGAEFTLKNSFFNVLDLTTNLNVFQATVDATNVENQLEINQLSAFVKENVQVRLPKNFSFQVNGEYKTRASFAPSSGNDQPRPGGGGGPGGHGMGGSQNSAQGYTKPLWFVDASVKKDFWKNTASLTLSVQDVFASRRFGSVTETAYFTQDTERLMNPQLVRLNFSYKFGKVDASLFNRKNTRQSSQGGDMM